MSSSVLADFLWFTRITTTNRARRFLGRLRSPRYAIAVILGLLYFGFIFLIPTFAGNEPGRPPQGSGVVNLLRNAGALVLVVLAASWWLWRTDRDAIALSPAEANMLVPAPLTRKQLIQFKLLGSQPTLMLSALFMSLFTQASPLPLPARFAASWALFSTLQLHRFGASLVHTSLAEQGRAGWRRVWPAALVFAALVACIAYPLVTAFTAGGLTLSRLAAILETEPARTALLPFASVMAAVNATDMALWRSAMVTAIVILAVHYAWVIRMDAAFEEGAADAGVKRAKVVEAMRSGNSAAVWSRAKPNVVPRRPWFPLAAAGEPTVAVLWKNVLGVTRGISARLLVTIVSVTIFMVIMLNNDRDGSRVSVVEMAGVMALSYGAMITFIAPTRIRHDFRSDMRKFELLRTLPIGGTRLAAAEITTSTFILTLMQFALMGAGVACLVVAGKIAITPLTIGILAPVVLALIAMNATMIVIHNAFALLYPTWAGQKPGGVEMFGLMMLTILGSLLFFILSLVGPALVGTIAGVGMAAQWRTYAYVPAIAATLAALYAQLFLLTVLLGRAYDRMDPSGRGGILA